MGYIVDLTGAEWYTVIRTAFGITTADAIAPMATANATTTCAVVIAVWVRAPCGTPAVRTHPSLEPDVGCPFNDTQES